MKVARLLLVFTLGCIVVACNMAGIRGSGTLKTEARSVSGFTAVQVHGSAKLIVEQSDTESLSVTADDNLLQHLKSEVRGSSLILGPEGVVSLSPSETVTWKLTVRKLNSIGVSGDVAVDAKNIHTDSLDVAVSGAGDISITGDSARQVIAISGLGKYKGQDFKTEDTSIAISGAGEAVVAAAKRLDVQVSGAGEVRYVGSPEVTRSISGAGSVTAWTP